MDKILEEAAGRAAKYQRLEELTAWVSMLAGIAVPIFAGMALFGSGSWWPVLYAAITSAVGKWLWRGFRDNKRRISFEEEMIAKGMTRNEASEAWLRTYLGAERPQHSDVGQG